MATAWQSESKGSWTPKKAPGIFRHQLRDGSLTKSKAESGREEDKRREAASMCPLATLLGTQLLPGFQVEKDDQSDQAEKNEVKGVALSVQLSLPWQAGWGSTSPDLRALDD